MPSNDAEKLHVETAAQLRAWLQEHPGRRDGIWVVTWKRVSGRPAPTYDEVVEELLCFGWIDSTSGALDAERGMLWCAPRKRGSGWSRTNKVRLDRLERAGRMTDRGRALVEAAKADGSWTLLDDVEDLVVPPDLEAAFAQYPTSREQWEAFPRSVRRGHLEWIVQAKRDATRARRVEEVAEQAARGERANSWPRP